MKITFKRAAKSLGRSNFGYNNDLRDWIIKTAGKEVGFISNVSAFPLSAEDTREWQVWFSAKGRNICMKQRFNEEDIESAKV